MIVGKVDSACLADRRCRDLSGDYVVSNIVVCITIVVICIVYNVRVTLFPVLELRLFSELLAKGSIVPLIV